MSHFFVHVLVRGDINEAKAEEAVSSLLEPYSENNPVKPYKKDCYCKGDAAWLRAKELAEHELGTVADLREKFKAQYPQHAAVNPWTGERKAVRAAEKVWETEFTIPLNKLAKALLESQADKDEPAKDCTDCEGTGEVITNYNQDSKWDWWVIGGRWDGAIAKKEHSDNEGNVLPLKIFLQTYDAERDCPFAVVTPNGEWVERGKMGWWANVTDEMDDDVWKKFVAAIYAKFPDAIVVGVDCHV